MPNADAGRYAFFGRNASVLLDIIRFAAAFAVAATHLPVFVIGPRLLPPQSGNAAVCVFFVLSGFVIRFVTVSRVCTAREYWIDRGSRIYSVVVPALLLTIFFEGAAQLFHPAAFHHFAEPYQWSFVPGQLASNLTFTTGYWGYGATPLSNGPFWSLTFECVYYVLYGLLRYTRRLRWFLVPLILLMVGPSIALLFPVWLLGVLLYDVYNRLHARRAGIAISGVLCFLAVAAAAIFRHPIVHFLTITDVTQRRIAAAHLAASLPLGRHLFHEASVPWLDRLSISFYFTGTVLAFVLLFLLLSLDRYVPNMPRPAAARIRTVADSTFTLYLLHAPFFVLVFTLLGHPAPSWLLGGIIFAAAIVLSVVLAIQFDALKNWMRSVLRRRFVPTTARQSV
ncbi:MAG TPA: acyltransferase family protein [Acidobacteriaceae bacterium]|nr:acyltransferase family protein [Acidobacteriaceae bacterium]